MNIRIYCLLFLWSVKALKITRTKLISASSAFIYALFQQVTESDDRVALAN